MRKLLIPLSIFAACISGCVVPNDNTNENGNENENSSLNDKETGSAKLTQFEDEADFREYAANMLNNGYQHQYGWGNQFDTGREPTAAPEANDDANAGGSDGSNDETAGYSDTTTQEEGVQESDILKNDSQYLYFLSNGTLRIVQTNPPDAMQELAKIDLDGSAYDLYKLPNDAEVATRLVAITHEENWEWDDNGETFAYGMRLLEMLTHVVVLDVSDHASPIIESVSTFGGHSVQSRMIGTTLYLVQCITPDFYMMVDMNAGEVRPADIDPDQLIPDYSIQVGDSVVKEGKLISVEDIYRPEDPDGFGMTAILSLDVDDPAGFSSTGLFATPGNLYASTEAIYMTDTDWNFYTGYTRDTTDIYKFSITETGADLTAVGSIEGRVLNQYSMSEFNGYFRIATTSYPSWGWWGVIDEDPGFDVEEAMDEEGSATSGSAEGSSETRTETVTAAQVEEQTYSMLYVLNDSDGDGVLETTGSLTNIAPGEQIYSARFIGDRGFLVTFEQIDPLFTLDLSDPSNPTLVGELKVPGYSTYITPMDENHLLTIGQNIDTSNGWPRTAGIQLSIFDITDFANPVLKHQELIGDSNTWSEAIYNPKAFTYYPEGNMIALPIHHEDWGYGHNWDGDDEVATVTRVDEGDDVDTNGSGDGDPEEPDAVNPDSPDGDPYWPTEPESYFKGIYVYEVTPDAGFVKKGELSILEYDNELWWFYPSFVRGVFMGDYVYGVTDITIKATLSTDMSLEPWSLSIEQPEPEWNDEYPEEDPKLL